MGGILKFQQSLALQKHVESSFALKQLPRSYLILHPQREERRRLIEKLTQKLIAYTGANLVSYEEESWGQVYNTLATPSLFGEEEVVVWNGFKKIPEEVPEKILHYVLNPSPKAFLVLGAESSKFFSDLYGQGKKELVLLDMTEEKPWDKEKRLQQEVFQSVKDLGKTITPGALSRLMSGSGGDALNLESELNKIVSYVGDRTSIVEADVLAIGCSSPSAVGWQQAEGLVWDGSFTADEVDVSFLLALLGQVRYILQQARQVGWHLGQKKGTEEILKEMNLRSAQFQKISERLRGRSLIFFEKALECVYELEVLLKNSTLAPDFMLDFLKIKFTHLKRTYVR